MTFIEIMRDWGWLGVLLYFLIERVWPFLSEKSFPSLIKARTDEKKWQHQMEERRVVAMESLSKRVEEAMLEMTRVVTQQNERMSMLIAESAEHHRYTIDAVTDMRETVAVMGKKHN